MPNWFTKRDNFYSLHTYHCFFFVIRFHIIEPFCIHSQQHFNFIACQRLIIFRFAKTRKCQEFFLQRVLLYVKIKHIYVTFNNVSLTYSTNQHFDNGQWGKQTCTKNWGDKFSIFLRNGCVPTCNIEKARVVLSVAHRWHSPDDNPSESFNL